MALKRFTPELFIRRLDAVLPASWRRCRRVQAYRAGGAGLPPPEWLFHFWKFVGVRGVYLLDEWPLIPLCDGDLVSSDSVMHVSSYRRWPDEFLTRSSQVVNLTEALVSGGVELGDEEEETRIFDFGRERLDLTGEGSEVDSIQSTVVALQSSSLLSGLRRLGCPILHPGSPHLERLEMLLTLVASVLVSAAQD
eukprot:762970-Hanusia_phi.AAC.3